MINMSRHLPFNLHTCMHVLASVCMHVHMNSLKKRLHRIMFIHSDMAEKGHGKSTELIVYWLGLTAFPIETPVKLRLW